MSQFNCVCVCVGLGGGGGAMQYLQLAIEVSCKEKWLHNPMKM